MFVTMVCKILNRYDHISPKLFCNTLCQMGNNYCCICIALSLETQNKLLSIYFYESNLLTHCYYFLVILIFDHIIWLIVVDYNNNTISSAAFKKLAIGQNLKIHLLFI